MTSNRTITDVMNGAALALTHPDFYDGLEQNLAARELRKLAGGPCPNCKGDPAWRMPAHHTGRPIPCNLCSADDVADAGTEVPILADPRLVPIPFDARDWLTDGQVRGLPVAARGLLVDMVAIALTSPEPGRLIDGKGDPYDVARLARLEELHPSRCQEYVDDLIRIGIFDRVDGCLVFRGSVRPAPAAAA